jgi:O-acetyl-ADP-ribose deacetylase (regulator of RNase III)
MRNIFITCSKNDMSSIAIPSLGTGSGGLSVDVFARVAAGLTKEFDSVATLPGEVIFVAHTNSDFHSLSNVFDEVFAR